MPKISGVNTDNFSKINGISKGNISKVNGISGLFGASPTPTPTNTVTPTNTPTKTVTPTVTPSITPSITVSPTRTPTVTPSITPSITVSPTRTPTVTPSVTPSISVSPTRTPTVTPTVTPSITVSPTRTPTVTPTVTPTSSPAAASATPTPTVTPTPSPCVSYFVGNVSSGTTKAQACYNFPNPGGALPANFGGSESQLSVNSIIYTDRFTCSGVPTTGYYYDVDNAQLFYWDGSALTVDTCPTCNPLTVEFANNIADICNSNIPPMQQVFVDVDVNNLSDSNYLFQSNGCYISTAQPGYYTEQLGGGVGSQVYYWDGNTLSFSTTC